MAACCREPNSNVFCLSAPVRGITGTYAGFFSMGFVSRLADWTHTGEPGPCGLHNWMLVNAGVDLEPKVWITVDVDEEKGTVTFHR